MSKNIAGFLALFAVVIVVMYFLFTAPPPKQYHQSITSETFQNLSREEQVLACAKCHQQEYENEMLGPHANSYKSLEEHTALVNSSHWTQSGYTKFVNQVFENCARCHAPENLYETIYKDALSDEEQTAKTLAMNPYPFPTVRAKSNRATGIDCMSCHFDGTRVIASIGFQKKSGNDCPDYCSPKSSSFFSSDINCISCHAEAVTQRYDFDSLHLLSNVSCNGACHQEQDAKGKFTHYYYWRGDPAHKVRPKMAGGFFDGLTATKFSAAEVAIEWNTDASSHLLNECREMIAVCEVLNSDSQLLRSDTLRINRKMMHDPILLPSYDGHSIPGVCGFAGGGNSESVTKRIRVPKNSRPAFISVTGFQKEQYWFPDSLWRKVYSGIRKL